MRKSSCVARARLWQPRPPHANTPGMGIGAIRRMVAAASLAVIGVSATHAAPGGTKQALQQAKEFYTGLRFEKALVALDEALKHPNRLADLIEIYELQGLAHAALNRNDKAQLAFAHLLMLDPEHKLPDYEISGSNL